MIGIPGTVRVYLACGVTDMRRGFTKRQAVAKQLVNKAAAGDPRAMPLLLSEARLFEEQPTETSPGDMVVGKEEELVIESIRRRILAADAPPPPAPASVSPAAPAALASEEETPT